MSLRHYLHRNVTFAYLVLEKNWQFEVWNCVIYKKKMNFFLVEFVLVLILFLLPYFVKLLRFLGVIWCLKKDYHTTNYVNKLAENQRSSAAENILVSFMKFKLQEQARNHSVTQSVLSSIFPRKWRSLGRKR